MYSEIKKIINEMNGDFVGVGLDDELMKNIQSTQLNKMEFLDDFDKKIKTDNLICNYDTVRKQMGRVLRISKKVTSHTVYVYGDNMEEMKNNLPKHVELMEFENYSVYKIEYYRVKKNFLSMLMSDFVIAVADVLEFLVRI